MRHGHGGRKLQRKSGHRAALLRNMACELGQGFLLGRPHPLEHWLGEPA